MNIDIHLRRIERDGDDGDGMPPSQQQRVIRLLDGIVKRPALHPATIDEERDELACRLVARRAADIATDLRTLAHGINGVRGRGRDFGIAFVIEGDHLLGDAQPVDGDDGAQQLAVARRAEDLSPLADGGEADTGPGQRILLQQAQTVRGLGGAGLEELEAGRYGSEQSANGDGGSSGRASGRHRAKIALVHTDLRPSRGGAWTAEQCHL